MHPLARPHAPKAATTPKVKTKRIKVMAVRTGYYDHVRRREGDVFVIDEKDISDADIVDRPVPGWMKRVAASTPLQHSTAQEALNKASEEIRALRAPAQTGAEGDGLDVLG